MADSNQLTEQQTEAAAKELAIEWRSLPDPITGMSMSQSVGDTARVSKEAVMDALKQARKRYRDANESANKVLNYRR